MKHPFFLKMVFSICLIAIFLSYSWYFIMTGMTFLTTKPAGIDFMAFYTGTHIINQRNNENLYNLSTQRAVQQNIAPAAKSRNVFIPFYNPPFAALFFLPIAKLPVETAFAIWTMINISILVLMCNIILQMFNSGTYYSKTIIIIGITTFIPVLTSLVIGQLSIFIAFIFLLSFLLLKNNLQFRGGLMLSLLWIKPHFMILPLLAFIAQKRLKIVLGIATGSFILAVISVFLVGFAGIMQYISVLSSALGSPYRYAMDIKAQHSLQTAIMELFKADSPSEIRILWIPGVTIIAILLFIVWSKKKTLTSYEFNFQYSMLIIATLLVSPHTHFHDLTLLIPAGILLINRKNKGNAIIWLILSGYFIILLGFLIDVRLFPHFRPFWILINVGYLLFLLFFIFYLSLREE